jgi:hypothetical protein
MVDHNGITSVTNFIQIRSAVLEFSHTDVTSRISVHFTHIVKRTPRASNVFILSVSSMV